MSWFKKEIRIEDNDIQKLIEFVDKLKNEYKIYASIEWNYNGTDIDFRLYVSSIYSLTTTTAKKLVELLPNIEALIIAKRGL